MAKILTELEVASTGKVNSGYTSNLCCTAGRASVLNCIVTSPSGALSNLLITGVLKGGPAATENYFWFTGDAPPDVSNTGGTSAVPTITDCRWYTIYDNGTESYTSVSTSSVTWAYGKIAMGGSYSASNPPGYTAASYSSSSSNCQFSPGSNSDNRKLLGWAFIRGIYGGSTDYIRREVWQAGKSEASHSLSVYTSPLSTKIPGSGGTSEALVVTVTYYTTYLDGTTSSLDVTSSAIILYNTSDEDVLPSTWYNSSSYGRMTVGLNPTTTERKVGYGWAKATYNGYSAADRSTIYQYGYTPDGPTVVESFLVIAVSSSVPDISADGGYSEIPEIVGCSWVTRYSDGSTPSVDIPASLVTWSYGKVDKGSYTTSNPPSETVPQYYSGTIYGLFYANSTNSTSRTLLGWTFIKGVYNGSTDYARCEVYQSPRASTSEVYKVHVVPLTYNGTTYTTPAVSFYNGSSTNAGQAHSRISSTQTLNYYSWSLSKVTGLYIVENGSREYVRYITVRAHNGSILLDKYYIGGSSIPGYVPLSTSFYTSDYSSGQTIHIYYYYS